MAAYSIMFHHFHDAHLPKGQGAISAEELTELIKYVGRDRIIPAKEWMRRAQTGSLSDIDICLTFDDALRCQYRTSPFRCSGLLD